MPSQFYPKATNWLLHWVVLLRTYQFDVVSTTDPSWKKDGLYDSLGNKRLRTSESKVVELLEQARSQKFAMGGAILEIWRRSLQPPEANGGLEAKLPAAGGWEFGGKASSRRHGGQGAEPPALEKFALQN